MGSVTPILVRSVHLGNVRQSLKSILPVGADHKAYLGACGNGLE